MRSTQLQTLRAIQDAGGRITTLVLAERLRRPVEYICDRVTRLRKSGHVEVTAYERALVVTLTDRARALLETRARLDGETEPGLGYMQGKGAS